MLDAGSLSVLAADRRVLAEREAVAQEPGPGRWWRWPPASQRAMEEMAACLDAQHRPSPAAHLWLVRQLRAADPAGPAGRAVSVRRRGASSSSWRMPAWPRDAVRFTPRAVWRCWWPTRRPLRWTRSCGAEGRAGRPCSKFAIANPELAPYGRAAREALQRLGLWDTAQSKLVLGENVAQATQFVTSGAAQAGLTALSLLVGHEAAQPGPLPGAARQPACAVAPAHGAAQAASPAATALYRVPPIPSRPGGAAAPRFRCRVDEVTIRPMDWQAARVSLILGRADGRAAVAAGRCTGALARAHFMARQAAGRGPADAAAAAAAHGDRLLPADRPRPGIARWRLAGPAVRPAAGVQLRGPAARQPADQPAVHGPADPACVRRHPPFAARGRLGVRPGRLAHFR